MNRVLLTTTSFQDTPGSHHGMVEAVGYEIVREPGPLSEPTMLGLAGQFDAYLCGDDALTRAVIARSLPSLKVISKYGIGLDKIDLAAAAELTVPVLFTQAEVDAFNQIAAEVGQPVWDSATLRSVTL